MFRSITGEGHLAKGVQGRQNALSRVVGERLKNDSCGGKCDTGPWKRIGI